MGEWAIHVGLSVYITDYFRTFISMNNIKNTLPCSEIALYKLYNYSLKFARFKLLLSFSRKPSTNNGEKVLYKINSAAVHDIIIMYIYIASTL